MARADLHSALAVDRDIFRASLVDASLLDPVVRLEAGVPGPVRPFTVVREYQGPQGMYVEHFEIVDRDGTVRYAAPPRRITLRGEAFEDRFAHDVESMEVADGRPLELVCYIDDREIDRVPVFLETASGGDARVATAETFRKALQKGDIIWVTVPPTLDPRTRQVVPAHTQPVWFEWDRKAERIYLLDGPGEQHVPGLTTAKKVEVSARSKDHRSLVSRLPATVEVVPQDDPRWERFTTSALTSRLNLPDGDAARERWRRDCTVLELVPDFGTDEADEVPAGRPTAKAAASAPAGASAGAGAGGGADEAAQPAPSAPADDEPHVEAQIDQEVFDRLVAEGKPERVARAQAKAAYVRAERKRLKAAAGDG